MPPLFLPRRAVLLLSRTWPSSANPRCHWPRVAWPRSSSSSAASPQQEPTQALSDVLLFLTEPPPSRPSSPVGHRSRCHCHLAGSPGLHQPRSPSCLPRPLLPPSLLFDCRQQNTATGLVCCFQRPPPSLAGLCQICTLSCVESKPSWPCRTLADWLVAVGCHCHCRLC